MAPTVTEKEVDANMEDVIVRTVTEFDKPVTYVTVRMLNGFTLRESTTCVSPENYSEDVGRAICLSRIRDRVWHLLGYMLQEDLYRTDGCEYKAAIEGAANFMRGMSLDPQIPQGVRDALNTKVEELDALIGEVG